MNKLIRPLAIALVRYMIRLYKKRCCLWSNQQSNMNIAKQRLLRETIQYFRASFDSWGYLNNGNFCYSEQEYKNHVEFMEKTFPELPPFPTSNFK